VRSFERRAASAYPYFKLSAWDALSFTWKAGKVIYPTEDLARAAAIRPGRYRLSRTDESGRTDSEPFEV
jgi:hypothetical protein